MLPERQISRQCHTILLHMLICCCCCCCCCYVLQPLNRAGLPRSLDALVTRHTTYSSNSAQCMDQPPVEYRSGYRSSTSTSAAQPVHMLC
jgi:hypothetical protein